MLLWPFLMQAQWDMFQNLDFSQNAPDSMTGKAYWRSIPAVNIHSTSKDGSEDGDPCIKISGTYTGDHTGYIYQQYPIALKDYHKLRISASIKGEVKEGKGYIYAYSKQGEQFLQYQTLDKTAILGRADWRRVELNMWVGPDADRLRIGCALEGKGTLYVDDFMIEEIPPGNCDWADSTLAFMQECMDLIGRLSLHKHEIDTSQLLANWKRFSACASTESEIHSGLDMILKQVDKHSFFWPAETVQQWQNTSSDTKTADFPLARGHRIGEQHAYVWMPHFNSGDSISQIVFADHMQRLIDSLDHENLAGWVLDLRNNMGGNCWPMLAGIGPILGEGVCGYFMEDDTAYSWEYRAGMTYESGDSVSGISIPPYQLYKKAPPVAVLTGPMTVSSGEVVTVAFKNRPRTRLFGLPTGGFSTGNVNHTLSDGSMMFLTQSVYADRNREAYRHGIHPDEEIPAHQEGEEDLTLQRALEWLEKGK